MRVRMNCLGVALGAALVLGAAPAAMAGGGCTLRINQASNNTCMAIYSQTDLAQSFIPVNPSSCGAGVTLTGPAPPGAMYTIELWDNLPNAGGNLLASGTGPDDGTGNVDVFWNNVSVAPGNTYFLVFTADAAGQGSCIAGDTTNPYPGGIVYANAGYGPFPNFDYTFRHYGREGGGGGCNPRIVQDINGTCMATFNQGDLAQSFIAQGSSSCGASVQLRTDFAGGGNVTIALWSNLPNAGGLILAQGTVFANPGDNATVSWNNVQINPGATYYLVFTADAGAESMCLAGDVNNPYPGGNVFANPGYNPFPDFDYTFAHYNRQGGPQDCNRRINFGVTPDDSGNPNDCAGGNTVITTQYQGGHSIVFGTAVDNFNAPPVEILNDAACDPPCRSAGVPPFATDWWCQFRLPDNTRAGVTDFSAEVCFVDQVGGTVMNGYNNSREIIATAVTSQVDTETLTIVAPPGELIAYVQVTNPGRPSGVTVDCLNFPDPEPRITDCPWDFNGDGDVGPPDLAKLLDNWGPCAPAGDCEGETCENYSFSCDPDNLGCTCFTLFDGSGFCGVGAACGDPCPDGNCPPGFVCQIETCCGPEGVCVPEDTACELQPGPQIFEPFELTTLGQADENGIVHVGGGIAGGDPAYVCGTWSDTAVHLLDIDLNDLGSFPAGAPNPNGIATDGTLVYSGHFSTQEVVAYDLAGVEQFRWMAPELAGCQGLEYIPEEDAIAVASSGSINFLDRLSGAFIRSIPLNGFTVEGITWDGAVLWQLDDMIYGINKDDGSPITTIPNANAACQFNGTGIANSGADELTLACTDGTWAKVSKADGSMITSGNNGLDMFGLKALEVGDPPVDCKWDFNGDGDVGPPDLAKLLDNWGPCEPVSDCEGQTCETYTFDCDPDNPNCVCYTLFDGTGFCGIGTACGDVCPDGNCPPGFLCVADTCCGPTTCLPDTVACELNSPTPQVFEPFQMTTLGQADKNGIVHPQEP